MYDEPIVGRCAIGRKWGRGCPGHDRDPGPALSRQHPLALAEAFGIRPPPILPGWVIRLAAPYSGVITTRMSMRLSNAKAKKELGWKPSAPTYREGVARFAAAARR